MNQKKVCIQGLVILGLFTFAANSAAQRPAVPIDRADGVELSKAQGHYARARAMLLSAVREFDKGSEVVNPDALLDAQEWRGIILDRARDLEHVLDPQPRVSNGPGARFEPHPGLLGEAGGN